MKNIRMFDLSLPRMVLRFYLMMLVTIVVGSLGLWWLAAILAMVIAISFITGMHYEKQEPTKTVKEEGKFVRMEPKRPARKTA